MPESVNKRIVRAVKRNATSILAGALAASMAIGGIGYGLQNARSQADKLHATEADARAANAIQERQSLEIKAAQAERESRSSARDVYVREMQKAETEERWNDALRFGEAALALTPNGGPRDEIVRHIRVISGEVPVQIRIPPGVRMTYQIDLVKEGSTEGVFPPHGSASESRSVPLVRGKTYMIGVGCEDGAQYSFCIRPQKPMEILLRNVPALPGFIFLPQEVQNIYVSRWPVAWDSYQQFLRANRIDPAIDNPLIPRDARGPFTTERIRLEQLSGSHPVTGISITQAERFLAYFQVGLNRSGKSGYTARLPTLKELEAAVVSGYTYPWGGTIRPEMMRSVPENVRSSSPMGSYLIPTSIHTGSSDRAPDPRCAVTLSRLHLSNISILVSDEGHFYSAMSDCTETDPRLHAVIESRAGGPRIPAREISRDASSTYTGFYIVVEPPK